MLTHLELLMNITKPMKTIVSVSTLCAVMAFSSIASSAVTTDYMFSDSPKQHQKRGGQGDKKMMKRMIKVLSLSEVQQEQIKSIKLQAKGQHMSQRVVIQQFKEAEKALIHSNNFNEKTYTDLYTANQQTFANMALTRAQTKHAIFNVLTKEQQAKWIALKDKRRGKGQGKGQGREKFQSN